MSESKVAKGEKIFPRLCFLLLLRVDLWDDVPLIEHISLPAHDALGACFISGLFGIAVKTSIKTTFRSS